LLEVKKTERYPAKRDNYLPSAVLYSSPSPSLSFNRHLSFARFVYSLIGSRRVYL